MEFSQELIRRSGYECEGFAAHYERFRPRTPRTLVETLCRLARTDRPRLVVDLGSGTGLSTRVWTDVAERVIGIEANPAMQAVAQAQKQDPNIEYRHGFGHDTGLEDGSADLVTCSQSLHWMEPEPTFAEAARILRPGGVFAAYDYDVPPLVDAEVDEAFEALLARRGQLRGARGIPQGADMWPKEGHLERMRACGKFTYCRELVLHSVEEGNAEQLVGFARSLGLPSVVDAENLERELRYEELETVAQRVLGDRKVPFHWGYRVRVGIV